MMCLAALQSYLGPTNQLLALAARHELVWQEVQSMALPMQQQLLLRVQECLMAPLGALGFSQAWSLAAQSVVQAVQALPMVEQAELHLQAGQQRLEESVRQALLVATVAQQQEWAVQQEEAVLLMAGQLLLGEQMQLALLVERAQEWQLAAGLAGQPQQRLGWTDLSLHACWSPLRLGRPSPHLVVVFAAAAAAAFPEPERPRDKCLEWAAKCLNMVPHGSHQRVQVPHHPWEYLRLLPPCVHNSKSHSQATKICLQHLSQMH